MNAMSLWLTETKGKFQKKTGSPVCRTIDTIVILLWLLKRIPK